MDIDNPPKYVPGMCNIDASGRKKRLAFGIVVLAISLIVWFFLRSWGIWQLLVVIPLWLGFNGIWQAVFSFCVGNAGRHQYEFAGKVEKVIDHQHIEKDKKKAMQINVYSLASAIILTIILFFI